MRLAIVAQNLVYGDGQGRINLEIARQALRLGIEVIVVSVVVDPQLIHAGAVWERVHVIRRPILVRVAHFPFNANRIVERLQTEGRIDRVIANGFTLTRPHDLNLCQFVHSAWLASGNHNGSCKGPIHRAYQSIYTRYNAQRERRAYAAAAKVIAPSRQTAEELGRIGIPARKVHVIPNGVDCEEFSPGPGDRKSLGLPADVPLALFTGGVRTDRKGLSTLLQALVRLPGVHLAVVGQTNGSPFPRAAAELGVADRVHFLGFRQDVPRIMRSCDLFVFPSWYEPFGLVVTEALACGLPVVTTACTGAAELLDETCGTIVPQPGDAPALAAAMKQWLFDPGRRLAAAPAARAVAQANGWEKMANQYLDMLEGAPAAKSERQGAADRRAIAYLQGSVGA